QTSDFRPQTSDLRPHLSGCGSTHSRFYSCLQPACSPSNGRHRQHNRAVLRGGENSAPRPVNLKQPKETGDIPFCWSCSRPRRCWLGRNSPHAAAEISDRKLRLAESFLLSCKLLQSNHPKVAKP